MAWGGQRIRFWAIAGSIGLHCAVLAGFCIVRVSQSQARAGQAAVPAGQVRRMSRAAESPPEMPKPRVRPPEEKRTVVRANEVLSSGPAREELPAVIVPALAIAGDTTAVREEVAATAEADAGMRPTVEFFESRSEGRSVCFVVDCSGSMRGLWSRVRTELCESIENLQADQYFYIIVFGGGRLFESGNGSVLRATAEAKQSAYDFVDSVQPAGITNAIEAIERAVEINSAVTTGPLVIYFLTDGFELNSEDAGRFSCRVTSLVKGRASGARINTIGFWADVQDRRLLEIIAGESGGEFTAVGDNK